MSVKVVVAVGNKKIERCIARMEAIDVLTTVRKREAVLDAVINYNPHAVILSRELSGKTEMTDVIQRCRNLKEQCRIVFIYGEVDAEYKYFSDFLVRQGIYNILTGAVDEDRLEDVIERTYTAEDVVGYQAGPEEDREPIPKPIPEVRPVAAPEQEKELEILLVEKIVERETIQTKVLGNVVIGVAALYPHGGSTHTALELAACLHRLKKDVGVLTDRFLKASCKRLVCGVSVWEIDTLTDYLRGNKYADTIEYLLWPANEAQAKSYIKNLRQGKCRGYAVAYNPDPLIKNTENTKMFQKLLQPLMDTI